MRSFNSDERSSGMFRQLMETELVASSESLRRLLTAAFANSLRSNSARQLSLCSRFHRQLPKFRSYKLPDFPETSFCLFATDRLRQKRELSLCLSINLIHSLPCEQLPGRRNRASDAGIASIVNAAGALSEHEVRVCGSCI